MTCNGSGYLDCYCAGDHCACGCPPECPGCEECAPEPDQEVRCAQLEAELALIRKDLVSDEGMLRLCATYNDRLKDSAGIARVDSTCTVWDIVHAAAHVRWMLSVMPGMKNPVKANRWLGFVQGVLFAIRAYTIDEMRAQTAGVLR